MLLGCCEYVCMSILPFLVCVLSDQEVQLFTLTDTPDDMLEKRVESLKVFYASHKVWCV